MRRLRLGGLAALLLLGTGGAADVDHTRALLYRVDAEARGVRLHPEQAWGPAQEVARQAEQAAALLDPDQAAALKEEAEALAAAARRDESEDVRAHAIKLEELVRHLDELLPPHQMR